MKIVTRLCLLCALLCGGGCASDFTMLLPTPPANAQKLGRVDGKAAGTVFAIIPVGENSRTQRAYRKALAKAPGATALTDVTIKEDWYWYYYVECKSLYPQT